MARPCICPFCQTEVKKEEAFEYKRKYYHVDCFGVLSKQKTGIEKAKKKQQVERAKTNVAKETHITLEESISDEDILAKEKVINYLKELLNVDRLNVKIYKLLKDYYNTYKFSYEGMLLALQYFYGIQGNPVVSDAVGIIPYIYDEAQEYYKLKKDVEKHAETVDLSKAVKERVVAIKIERYSNKDKLIDIAGLE